VEIITLLVMESKRYYHGHLDRIDDEPSPLPNMTEAEMLVFFAITIQMGHSIRDKLTYYGQQLINSTQVSTVVL